VVENADCCWIEAWNEAGTLPVRLDRSLDTATLVDIITDFLLKVPRTPISSLTFDTSDFVFVLKLFLHNFRGTSRNLSQSPFRMKYSASDNKCQKQILFEDNFGCYFTVMRQIQIVSNYSIIRVTLNTEFDTLWFVKETVQQKAWQKSMIPFLKAEFLELYLEWVSFWLL